MSWSKLVGWLMVAGGVVAFLTIADDLNHVGELLGAASVFVVGILLLFAGSTNDRSRRVAAFWLAGAVGIGAVIGAASDNMPVGVGGGLTMGLVCVVVLLRRPVTTTHGRHGGNS